MFCNSLITHICSNQASLRKMILPVILLGLIAAGITANTRISEGAGRLIYVSSSGNDNNSGSISKPLRTIQAAVDRATSGDTIYVRQGTYAEAVRIARSGTSGNPITIRAYPGESPVIDGRAGVDCLNCGLPSGPIDDKWIDPRTGKGLKWGALVTIQGNHIIFDDFVIKRSMGRGIIIGSDTSKVSNVTVKNNLVLDSRDMGILTEGKEGNERIVIEHNTVRHSGSYATWVDGRGSGNAPWPVAFLIKNSNNTTVRRNRVYENWGEGLSTRNSTNITVEDNIVYNNFALQIYVHKVQSYTLQRNVIYHTNDPSWRRGGNPSDCIVINNETDLGPLVSKKIDIINNVASGCVSNFSVWEQQGQELRLENFLVAHNVFANAVSNRSDVVAQNVRFRHDSYYDFKFENNIVYQGKTDNLHKVGTVKSGVSYSYNLWFPRLPESGPGSGAGDVVGLDPRFADPRAYELPQTWSQEPNARWFSIKSGSPAVDQGKVSRPILATTDILLDLFFGLRDTSPDIGVHEYGSLPPNSTYLPMVSQ